MFNIDFDPCLETVDIINSFRVLPQENEVQPNHELENLLADLTSETSWYDRQIAAQKLGYMHKQEALSGLLCALLVDPFWMVRCAIIQALEIIGDARAIPTLRKVAESDGFQVVRSYAAKAIERLSKAR